MQITNSKYSIVSGELPSSAPACYALAISPDSKVSPSWCIALTVWEYSWYRSTKLLSALLVFGNWENGVEVKETREEGNSSICANIYFGNKESVYLLAVQPTVQTMKSFPFIQKAGRSFSDPRSYFLLELLDYKGVCRSNVYPIPSSLSLSVSEVGWKTEINYSSVSRLYTLFFKFWRFPYNQLLWAQNLTLFYESWI